MEDEGADNETEEAAAASEAGSEPQAPPSVFINHIDTFFGSNLVKRFASPYRVVGTLRDAPVPAQDPQSQITIVVLIFFTLKLNRNAFNSQMTFLRLLLLVWPATSSFSI